MTNWEQESMGQSLKEPSHVTLYNLGWNASKLSRNRIINHNLTFKRIIRLLFSVWLSWLVIVEHRSTGVDGALKIIFKSSRNADLEVKLHAYATQCQQVSIIFKECFLLLQGFYCTNWNVLKYSLSARNKINNVEKNI